MLQIIGWLGCLYLLVKAVEIATSNSFRNGAGKIKEGAVVAAMVAFWGSVGFAIWLGIQGGPPLPVEEASVAPPLTERQVDCVQKAKTDAEVLAC